jgi:hypothetical protein
MTSPVVQLISTAQLPLGQLANAGVAINDNANPVVIIIFFILPFLVFVAHIANCDKPFIGYYFVRCFFASVAIFAFNSVHLYPFFRYQVKP